MYSSKQPSWVDFIFHFTDEETNIWKVFSCRCPVFSLIFHFLSRHFSKFQKLISKYMMTHDYLHLPERLKVNISWRRRFSLVVTPHRWLPSTIVNFYSPCAFLHISFPILLYLEMNPFICSPGHIVCIVWLQLISCGSHPLKPTLQIRCRLFLRKDSVREKPGGNVTLSQWPSCIPNMKLCLGRSSACLCRGTSLRCSTVLAQRRSTTCIP